MSQNYFRLSTDYIDCMHAPDADLRYPYGNEICGLARAVYPQPYILIPAARRDLIAEVVLVAELCTLVEGEVDLRAYSVLKRARKFLLTNRALH